MSQYVVSVEPSSLIHHRSYPCFVVFYVDSLMGEETLMRTVLKARFINFI